MERSKIFPALELCRVERVIIYNPVIRIIKGPEAVSLPADTESQQNWYFLILF